MQAIDMLTCKLSLLSTPSLVQKKTHKANFKTSQGLRMTKGMYLPLQKVYTIKPSTRVTCGKEVILGRYFLMIYMLMLCRYVLH